MVFSKDRWVFNLVTPSYEAETFGHRIGELTLANEAPYEGAFLSMDILLSHLRQAGIPVCTFRGKENTHLIQYLEDVGFRFVGTFYGLSLTRDEFKPTNLNNHKYVVEEAYNSDFDRILEIEKDVFDYSTYQMDTRLPSEATAIRNIKRVRYYFDKPNHHTFVIKKDGLILGFIQFLYEKDKAFAVNGAIDKDHHEKFMGSIMYSGAFESIFNSGIDTIVSGVCSQNERALKIHLRCGFRIIESEIHLRWIER